MSIVTPPPLPSSPSSGSGTKSVSEQLIDARIVEACKALWWAEVVRTLLRLVIAAIGLLLVWVVVDQWVYSPGNGLRIVFFAAICIWLVHYVVRRVVPLLGSVIRPEYAARSLERDLPELRQSLTSYVTLRDDQEAPGLRSRVVRSIGAAAAGRLRTHDELPQEATGTLRLWIVAAISLAMFVAYAVVSPKNSLQSAARLAVPFASIDPALRVSIRDVKPGDVAAIAGREVEVSALIAGMRGDEEAFCRWDLPAGRQEVVLSLDTQNRRHTGTILLPHSATGDVDYVIVAGDAKAGPFRLQVQDVPVVALQTVRYQPPKYTGQSPHTSSSGAITALDGTRVTILATTNRPVAKAKIEFNPRVLGESIQATAGVTELEIDTAGTSLSVSFPLRSARGRSAAVELESYRIKVLDAANQGNPEPIIYPIRVIADLPPDVAIMMPVKSPQDVPIDVQQPFEIHASDPDFGLMQVALEIRAGIDLIAEPVLWSYAPEKNGNQGAKGNRVSEYGFRPAEHDLRIGDTVQIVAVAIDNRTIEHDPSVEPNVTRSDPIELRITAGSDPLQGEKSADEQSPDDRPRSNDPGDKSKSSGGGEGQPQSGGSGGGGSGEQQSGDGNSGGDSTADSQSGESSGENSGEGGSGGGGAGERKSADQDSGGDQPGDGDSSEGSGDSSGDGSSGGAGPQQGQSAKDSMSQREGQTPSDPSPSGSNSQDQGASSEGGQPADSKGQDSSTASTPSGEAGDAGGDGQPSSAPDSNGDASSSGNSSNGDKTGDDVAGNDATENGTPTHDGETFERIRDYLEQKRKEQQASGGGSKPENPQSDSSNAQSGDQNQSSDQPGSQGEPNPGQKSAGDGSNEKSEDGNSGEETGASTEQAGGESGERSMKQEGSPSQSAGDGSGLGSTGDQQGNSEPQRSGNQQGTGDQQTGEGQPSPGEEGSKSSDQNNGDGSGDQSAESSAGNNQNSGDSGKNGSTGDQASGDQSSGDQSSGNQSSGQNERGGEQQSETDQPAGDQSRSDQPTGSATPSGDPPTNQSPSSDATAGTGAGSDGVGEAGDSPMPPDPVNVDYAKKAADMVLDYLEETRDAPDRELLDKLNWTEQDLKRFADRWQDVRDIGQADDLDPSRSRDVEEALRSLGMRPPTEAGGSVKDSADSLRGIRDAGNRKPPPAAYRDAFDAFRRAVGRQ